MSFAIPIHGETAARPENILVLGRGPRLLELLRLAVLRSDTVTAIGEGLEAPARRFIDHFAIEWTERTPEPTDLAGADAVLIALGDKQAENAFVRAARRNGTPTFVADRPLVSDFTSLAFLEQRPIAF